MLVYDVAAYDVGIWCWHMMLPHMMLACDVGIWSDTSYTENIYGDQIIYQHHMWTFSVLVCDVHIWSWQVHICFSSIIIYGNSCDHIRKSHV